LNPLRKKRKREALPRKGKRKRKILLCSGEPEFVGSEGGKEGSDKEKKKGGENFLNWGARERFIQRKGKDLELLCG